jgi:O-methyltransferase involved in polyketide biosynthesis
MFITANWASSQPEKMLRLLVLIALGAVRAMMMTSTMPRFQRAWKSRGVYKDRRDMPPLKDSAEAIGVDPPLTAPRWVWSSAWRVGQWAMPILHRWDDANVSDTNVNLWVCWLKAIAGNRNRGGYADGGLAYEMLPAVTRRVVAKPLASLYPRLHHQNVAMRTAYLDRAVVRELALVSTPSSSPVVLVLGAGFDTRPFRLRSTAPTAAWAEIDLPHVVQQKRRLLARLARRRPELAAPIEALTQRSANLTVASEARTALSSALRAAAAAPLASTVCSRGADDDACVAEAAAQGRSVIYVIEALLIYLPKAAAAELLRACVDVAQDAGAARVSLVFADRLPDVEACVMDSARKALRDARLELDEATWLPKPGLARHMGVARWNRTAG